MPIAATIGHKLSTAYLLIDYNLSLY
jgi:hypothetical protein